MEAEGKGRPASFEHRTPTQGCARKLVESVGNGVKLVVSARMSARDLSEIIREGRMGRMGLRVWEEEIRDPFRSQAQREEYKRSLGK